LDPAEAEEDSKEMWSSFDEFFAADRGNKWQMGVEEIN